MAEAERIAELEAEVARLQASAREAWQMVHNAGRGEWGEFTDSTGQLWVVRYWSDRLGWIVTSFRQEGEARAQCFWTDLPEEVKEQAVSRLGILMPECRVRRMEGARAR